MLHSARGGGGHRWLLLAAATAAVILILLNAAAAKTRVGTGDGRNQIQIVKEVTNDGEFVGSDAPRTGFSFQGLDDEKLLQAEVEPAEDSEEDDFAPAPSTSSTCTSPACRAAAAAILDTLDASADPCADFYRFACGKFLREGEIPAGSSKLEMLTPMNKRLMAKGRALLDENYEDFVGIRDDDWPSFELARDHFRACMDGDERERLGVKPLKQALEAIGGWPVADDGDEEDRVYLKWFEMEAGLARTGLTSGHVVSLGVVIDARFADRHILRLSPPKLGIGNKALIKGPEENPMCRHYLAKMVSAAMLLSSGSRDEDEIAEEMRSALEFERRLAKVQEEVKQVEKIRDAKDESRKGERGLSWRQQMKKNAKERKHFNREHQYKLSDLPSGAHLPSNWTAFVSAMLLNQLNVTADFEVAVIKPSYLRTVDALLAKTEPRTVANYFVWRIVDQMLPYLHAAARKIVSTYRAAVKGKQHAKESPRWHRCVHALGFNNYNSHAVAIPSAAMFVRRFVDDAEKDIMEEMIESIRDSFGEVIKKSNWMDEETKVFARKKLGSMRQNVVFPPLITNRSFVEGYLKGLNISRNTYFQNVLNIQLFDDFKCVEKMYSDPESSSWRKSSFVIVVNAFYQPKTNRMSFPAAFLQGNMFHSGLPLYMNYGGVGSIVGHEITHGFDDNGRKFDHTGSKRDWWDPSTLEAFVNKTSCMRSQYDEYQVADVGKTVDGKLTLGENIADNGGMKINYLGYDRVLRRHGTSTESSLPGLERFGPRQMFWINHAHTFCSKVKPRVMEMKLKTSVHAPMEFRINGVYANSDIFARDFDCPEGSPMNPQDKCIVW